MLNRTRVFISYSHDSEQHTQFVLELAERLIEDGFNCIFDFYLDEDPVEGWQAWLETELAQADFVLVICTPNYLQQYQNNELVVGAHEDFKGLVISQEIYTTFAKHTKFVPIYPEGGNLRDIIPPLQGQNAFELMTDYLSLHQLLKNKQAKLAKAEKQAATAEGDGEIFRTSQTLANDSPKIISQQSTDKPLFENKLFFYLLILALGILLFISVFTFL